GGDAWATLPIEEDDDRPFHGCPCGGSAAVVRVEEELRGELSNQHLEDPGNVPVAVALRLREAQTSPPSEVVELCIGTQPSGRCRRGLSLRKDCVLPDLVEAIKGVLQVCAA
ncbi:unnamed protein product, partial [Durusdinium trenchii]